MGWKAWTRERLTSADVQDYLMDQSVLQFASAAVRDAELLDTKPGMIVYLQDVDRHYRRNAADSAWQALGCRHHGSATAFPTTGIAVGDTIERTDYRCLFVLTAGTGDVSKLWRQIDVAFVDDRAGRLALPTTNMHDGFLVHELAGNRRYSWDGTGAWIMEAGPPQAADTSTARWTNGTNWTVTSSILQEIGQGFAQITVTVDRTTSTVPLDSKGELANTTMATLVAGAAKWLPNVSTGLVSWDGSRGAHGYLHADGRLILTHVAPGGTGPAIAVGETMQLSGIYRLADPALHG